MKVSQVKRNEFVNNIINNDIFDVLNQKEKVIIDLLSMENPKVKHAVVSVMSILSSTEKGIVYLLNN